MKRLPLVVLAALSVSLAACGGDDGGGDQEAFCDALETLSDQVGDGDLASGDGRDDVIDTVNELIESADGGEQLEVVRDLGEEINDADDEDADNTVEAIQDELGDFAESCDIDEDEFAAAPETTTTTEVEDPTTTTSEVEDPTTTTIGGEEPPPGDSPNIGARQPVPADIAAEFAGQAQACFDGDMAACDTLFAGTPVDSVDEAYGETCGGRLAEAAPGQCSTLITGPIDVPADIVDQATASACAGGDMIACDDLFRANSGAGTIDEAYGALCGGRVQNTDAFCVDIFGDVAFA